MCLIVIPSNTLTRLVAAAQSVQSLVDDETLSSAYVGQDADAQAASIAAFDRLAECASAALAEHKTVSPFIRYKKEALDETNLNAKSLRRLVLNLCDGKTGVDLCEYFQNADPLYNRIGLEMIANYSQRGYKDAAFICLLADEIKTRFWHEIGGEA